MVVDIETNVRLPDLFGSRSSAEYHVKSLGSEETALKFAKDELGIKDPPPPPPAKVEIVQAEKPGHKKEEED